MAKCKRCGKKGLLLKVDESGLCAECAALMNQELDRILIEQEEQIARLDEELAYQDKLLDIVLKARDEYSKGGDIEKAIESLEEAIVKAKPPLLRASGHTVFLIDLYKKTGQNDKAWGLLNSCLMDASLYGAERLAPSKIRLEMAKILKSEKKYSAAIEMYMLVFLHDGAAFHESYAEAHEEKFRKNIKPCLSKLKWDEGVASDLITLVKDSLAIGKSPAASEAIMIEQYRTYLNNNNLD